MKEKNIIYNGIFIEIRKRLKSVKKLSIEYNISENAIRNVINFKSWKNI